MDVKRFWINLFTDGTFRSGFMHALANFNTQIKANPSSVLSLRRFLAFDLHIYVWYIFTSPVSP